MAVAQSDPPQLKTIRKQLGTLATHGVVPYWVIDRCPVLLGLKCIEAHAPANFDGPAREAPVEALVAYLRTAVPRVEFQSHQIILQIVLAIEEDSAYLGTTAVHRRTAAGKQFRGPRDKGVTWGCIRQHHEPRALDNLANIVHQDELVAQGA